MNLKIHQLGTETISCKDFSEATDDKTFSPLWKLDARNRWVCCRGPGMLDSLPNPGWGSRPAVRPSAGQAAFAVVGVFVGMLIAVVIGVAFHLSPHDEPPILTHLLVDGLAV